MDNQNSNNSYEQPAYQQPVSPEQPQKTDTLAIVSLILGIAAIVLGCCVTYLGIALGVGGIICSVMSKKKQKSGLATAGLVCSIIGIVFAVIWIIFSVAIMGMLAASGIDISSYM
ncbi:MAG: DUF4190 domain-containing protein [Acetatifactor sp.]|nr:DUF4190 domain-containing protein [Acetatifactor sp.]